MSSFPFYLVEWSSGIRSPNAARLVSSSTSSTTSLYAGGPLSTSLGVGLVARAPPGCCDLVPAVGVGGDSLLQSCT